MVQWWITPENPEPWNSSTQEHFLQHAYHYHRKKKFEADWEMLKDRKDVMAWLYKLGRDKGILTMDYNEFCLIMTGCKEGYHEGVYRPTVRQRWRWYNQHYDPRGYRIYHRYRKLPHHEKKAKNQKKEDWWYMKGFIRTRRKSRSSSSWNRLVKEEERSKRRSFERKMFAAQKWEKMRSKTPVWHHGDRWNWD